MGLIAELTCKFHNGAPERTLGRPQQGPFVQRVLEHQVRFDGRFDGTMATDLAKVHDFSW